ncbi:MAG: CD225/dispanin family protein [Mediterranea sp.]|nr:CD225/dispanin family protein [Mediterranea sp.]
MNCKKCGAEAPENAVVCSRCGANLQETSSNANAQKPTETVPPSYLVVSILATLFCCLPFGIVGIVNAAKVESRFYAGDIEGAKRASANAKMWTWISVLCGLVIVVAYLILLAVGVTMSPNMSGLSI